MSKELNVKVLKNPKAFDLPKFDIEKKDEEKVENKVEGEINGIPIPLSSVKEESIDVEPENDLRAELGEQKNNINYLKSQLDDFINKMDKVEKVAFDNKKNQKEDLLRHISESAEILTKFNTIVDDKIKEINLFCSKDNLGEISFYEGNLEDRAFGKLRVVADFLNLLNDKAFNIKKTLQNLVNSIKEEN